MSQPFMHCSRRAILGFLSSSALVPALASAEPRGEVIYLQPLGGELAETDFVGAAVATFFDLPVRALGVIELPQSAYYKPRSRYRAEKLLPILEKRRPEDGLRILGLTAVDISTTKPPHADWGILGLATIGGRACVSSSFRTKRGAKDTEHARIRLAKTVVHEMGHTLGLHHCPERGCLMGDGGGTVTTTDRCYDFCADCRISLKKRGVPLTTFDVPAPWPKPSE